MTDDYHTGIRSVEDIKTLEKTYSKVYDSNSKYFNSW